MPKRFKERFSPSLAATFAALAVVTTATALTVGELESGGSASAAGSKDSPTRVFGRFKDRAVDITTNDSDPLTLSVPAGNYAILAKATVGGIGLATCRLLAGDDFDETSFNNPTIKSTTSTLTLTVLHSSEASFKARLRCGDGKRDGSLIGFLEDIKLTAVKVDQLSNKAG
ncbi:MAG: hypothetical protein ACXW08_07350 [Solirubrobacteraceae bacterium]